MFYVLGMLMSNFRVQSLSPTLYLEPGTPVLLPSDAQLETHSIHSRMTTNAKKLDFRNPWVLNQTAGEYISVLAE